MKSHSSELLKKALSNEEPSDPMHQFYHSKTASTNFFTLKTNTWHWTKHAKTFSCKEMALITEIWQ
jgi:hypothetical protein